MKRPHYHPKKCKVCGKGIDHGIVVSQTGLCPDHSRQRFEENAIAMKTMTGPYARNWRRAMAASVGGLLLDELPDKQR